MAYQTVTKTSYGQRLKNSAGGVGAGFLMLIAGTILLFWNEGRTVKTTRMLKEAQGVCVELGDINSVNAEMNGKMIHATGLATTDEILREDQFGVSANAIKLSRTVEYYQWVEHTSTETKDKVGGGQETITTYTYDTEWVSSPVNSSSFEDPDYRNVDNDPLMTIENEELMAENVTFGAYRLPAGLVGQMNNKVSVPVELDQEYVDYLNTEFHKVYDVAADAEFVHVTDNVVYLGINPGKPYVGDVRITFKKVNPGEVSILAKVNGDTFEQFTGKNGKTLLSLTDGSVSMDGMFESEHSSNKTMAWVLRIVGILLVFFGFKNIFNILVTLLKVLPFLANIANLGINLVCGILTFAWCLIVIALGWLFYRPVLGIILLVAAGALIWYLGKRSKEAKAAAPAEAPAAPVVEETPVAPKEETPVE